MSLFSDLTNEFRAAVNSAIGKDAAVVVVLASLQLPPELDAGGNCVLTLFERCLFIFRVLTLVRPVHVEPFNAVFQRFAHATRSQPHVCFSAELGTHTDFRIHDIQDGKQFSFSRAAHIPLLRIQVKRIAYLVQSEAVEDTQRRLKRRSKRVKKLLKTRSKRVWQQELPFSRGLGDVGALFEQMLAYAFQASEVQVAAFGLSPMVPCP